MKDIGHLSITAAEGRMMAISTINKKSAALIVAKPTKVLPKSLAQFPWCNWGDNDTHPQDVLKDIKKSTIIPSKLDEKARMLFAGGIEYGYHEMVDNKINFVNLFVPEIENWCINTALHRYLMDACKDLEYFNHIFAEITMTEDKKASGIFTHGAENCRLSWPDKQTGRYNFTYINKDRATITASLENSIAIPTLDAYCNPCAYILADKRHTNYIYPISYSVPGCEHYQIPDWDAVRQSFWLKYSLQIPDYKAKMMDNQISLKYLIEIADWYWTWKYPKFDSEITKRDERIQETFDEINAMLAGTAAAGKSILATFKHDPRNASAMQGIKITAIENKIKDGEYIDDGKMANEHLLYALNFDPALAGQTPGSERGSGSDIRVAYNKYISHILPKALLVLEPLSVISELNGWNAKYAKGMPVIWRFKQTMIATLDTGAQTKPLTQKKETDAI
jgi:hypothetical protein